MPIGAASTCEDCGAGAPTKLTRHHRDGDRFNNQPANIAVLCHACHAKADQAIGHWGPNAKPVPIEIPASTHRRLALNLLKPAPYNPRRIDDGALAGLRRSISTFGLVEPVVWNERSGNVVGGHQRIAALRAMGASDGTMIDAMVVDLDEGQERALTLALNTPAIAGAFTPDVHAVLDAIKAQHAELIDALCLDELEAATKRLLANLPATGGNTDGDDVPDPPPVPRTKPGDVWTLGQHRLICADCRDGAALSELMRGERAILYATDPPYGGGYDASADRNLPDGRVKDGDATLVEADQQWDHFADEPEFRQFLIDSFRTAATALKPEAAWYCWHATRTVTSFIEAWAALGLLNHQTITWIKPAATFGYSMWGWRFEPCLMGWLAGNKPPAYQVEGESSNVWAMDWEGKARLRNGLHPTQKPIAVFEAPMRKHTVPGEICLETFCGSGSQIIAAERLGRRCFAVERLPAFCDVAVARWEAFTGQEATR